MQLPNGLALEFERSDAARRIRLILSQLLFVVSEVRVWFLFVMTEVRVWFLFVVTEARVWFLSMERLTETLPELHIVNLFVWIRLRLLADDEA